METQFTHLGLPLERVNAALGADPVVRATAEVAPYASLSHGEVGCFESHRRFWQQVVDERLDGAYVIEDDLAVSSDYDQWSWPKNLLATADVIKIDQGVRNIGHYGTVPISVSGDRVLIRLLGTEFSTGCYFVTQKGAQALLKLSRSYFIPVDRFMFDQDSQAFWQLEIWKLDASAAIQMRLLEPNADGTELADSISANRISGRDANPKEGFVRQARLRLRRLLDWDTRRTREARKRRRLAQFAKTEPVETREIAFATQGYDHLDHAKPHLQNTPEL